MNSLRRQANARKLHANHHEFYQSRLAIVKRAWRRAIVIKAIESGTSQYFRDVFRWGASILADFDGLRNAGFKLPIMDEFERQFASEN